MKNITFNVSDIHKIRYANFKKTKKMTPEELIAYTKCKAEIIKIRLKKKTTKAINQR